MDVDVDCDWKDWGADGFWEGAAVAGATAAVVGSIASLPPACNTMMIGGLTYRDCDGVWYAPRYSGTDVVYVVVDDPR